MAKVTIYTDGACSGNGTPRASGGWAAIVKLDGSVAYEEFSGGEKPATNQRMEIRAAIEGLRALKRPCQVTLYSDSAYVINCMTKHWHHKWRRNGWIGSSKKAVANRDLWEALLDLVENHGHAVSFVKVGGHANEKRGHVSTEHETFNQRCDQLAVVAAAAAAVC